MKTDRELLQLAAKAAGIELKWPADPDLAPRRADSWDIWNPLTDDGDALRLAVKLRIDIRQFDRIGDYMDCLVDRLGRSFSESRDPDPYAATRRAIVRAAASIGEQL